MKTLVIGSKGFIGSHIYQSLVHEPTVERYGCDVVVDYVDPNYFVVDSSNSDFNEVFEHITFDICINCSGAASVPDSLVHPFRDLTLNVFTVGKILESIRKYAPSCKFMNLSSAAVYGNPLRLPIVETDECAPVSPYGMHKLISESICTEFYRYFNISTCSVRIFSAYGPGLRKQLLWDIFQKTHNPDTVRLFGNGNETRDFVFITDIVQAITLITRSGDFCGEIYNIANGEEVPIRKMAVELLKELEYKGTLLFSGEMRVGDPMNWKADISKISKLGYQPSFSVEEGVTKYVKWLKEERLL